MEDIGRKGFMRPWRITLPVGKRVAAMRLSWDD
jgi:hypothetical protein